MKFYPANVAQFIHNDGKYKLSIREMMTGGRKLRVGTHNVIHVGVGNEEEVLCNGALRASPDIEG